MTQDQVAEKSEAEQAAARALFQEKLEVDEEIANILVSEGFSTVEEIAYVPVGELLAVEGFDEDIVEELRDRKSTRLNSSHYCAARMPYPAGKKNEKYERPITTLTTRITT